MANLPNGVRRLLWDVDPASLDGDRHRNFLLDRILEYGDMETVRWAEKTYGREGIRDYFLTRGQRVLSNKTRAYWRLILKLDSCTTPSSTQPNNPLWPY
jgi:hypothetical protein